ncbi:DoxX family protein [Natrinema salsiterrestre]|uniref:DoxX family protein n=1 Tax=Natrinema salsiterrestre TaxID=2950540 RepID=A0A9Q4Q272_9EURY|nr:DoxX family protein [Natrinema salsiterrestre]MDF9746236.1 DoxX family protein [Natrinema salsiterrestre]
MAFESGVGAVLLLVGRLLFGGLLVFQGVNHFMQTDMLAGYAESKGIPAARFGVVASGVMLVLGGLGIVLGVYPVIAAGMLAVFFLAVTPFMHDFWAVPEEQQQNEMTHFLKNVELLGASLLVLVLAGETWGYALNIGL